MGTHAHKGHTPATGSLYPSQQGNGGDGAGSKTLHVQLVFGAATPRTAMSRSVTIPTSRPWLTMGTLPTSIELAPQW